MQVKRLAVFLLLTACAGPIPKPAETPPADRKSLTDDLRQHESELKTCFELAHDPNLAGQLILQWDIGARGKVSQVRVVKPLQPEVDDCVAGALENWTFRVEPGQDKVRRVLYPFTFSSRGE